MAFDSVPWLVGGGAEHSPEVGRLLAYAATSGASGIVGSSDLKVRSRTTPAGSVRIAPGAVVIPNKWSGQQTYLARNATETVLTVPSTGSSSGRNDLVIVRIDDPQYAGEAPANPAVGPYVRATLISGVASNATKASVNYPHVVLARINIPASTAAITPGMITDLREMANPRRQRALLTRAVASADADALDAVGTAGERWPNSAGWTVEIPSWATRVRAVGTWGQILYPGGSANGRVWANIGAGRGDMVSTQVVGVDSPSSAASSTRSTLMVADDRPIPSSMRGASVTAELRGRMLLGSPSAYPVADGTSAVVLDLEFLEAPDEDE